MNNDLISREALKKHKFPINIANGVEIEEIEVVPVEAIENAPTVDTTCPHCDSGYAQGYSDGYLRGKEESSQGELANEVWKLYEKYHSHLATRVLEFGDELKELNTIFEGLKRGGKK